MKKEPLSLGEIRQIELQILREIDRFCSSRGIRYSLAFGTLLGAIRHGGYIPWDDDIDIMMTRENYNKFRREYSSKDYPFIDILTNNHHPVPLGKVYDAKTFFFYKGNIKREYGVFVDVFPIDNMPDNIEVRRRWIKKVNRLIFLNGIKCNSWSVLLNSKHGVFTKVVRGCLKIFTNTNWIHRKLEALYTRYNNEDTKYMGAAMIFNNNKGLERVYPKQCFQNYRKIQFENEEFCAIQDYHTFLTIRYDNYMELPPIEDRVYKHGIIAYYK